jgi:hypothetical protein
MAMQRFVIDRPGENFLVVEEMQLLPVGQRDLRMLFQKIMQRSRAGLLRAGDDEIEPLNLSTFNAKHVFNRDTALSRCPRLSSSNQLRQVFVTGKRAPQSLLIMVHALARVTSTALAVVEFAIILAVLLVLGATAIPGLVRVRKH